MDVSFVGLGKLGLPLACTLAGSGNRIWGIDKNPYFIENLSNGNLPFYEPGLENLLTKHLNDTKHLSFSTSLKEAMKAKDRPKKQDKGQSE